MQPKNTQFIQQGPQSGFCSGGLRDRRTIREVMGGVGKNKNKTKIVKQRSLEKKKLNQEIYKVKEIFPQQN